MSESAIRVAVVGAAGRMGRTLLQSVHEADGISLGAALEAPDHPLLGTDAGVMAGLPTQGVSLVDDLASVIGLCDVLIDFTRPDPCLRHLEICAAAGVRAVVGTTGFDTVQHERIDVLAGQLAMVVAPNMSVGVNLCFKLIELASRTLGDGVDIEIIEAHHRHKVDAPSGTAVRMGEVVAEALGRDLSRCAVYGRQGHTGERDRKTIGFETIRAGDIVGEHTVMFADLGERVEITHRASSRANFANGAMRAVRWVVQRDAGRFDMQDVLELR